MVRVAIRARHELAPGDVLAAERYDPLRARILGPGAVLPAIPLGQLVRLDRTTWNAARVQGETLRVVDTTHAREGVLWLPPPAPPGATRSGKRVLRPGDVIISRLRPYLRQVGWVDPSLEAGPPLVCSTEFWVLRPLTEDAPESLAYLVPFLLSEPVQQTLAAAQEGGHHPRFSADVLLALPVPEPLLAERDDLSRAVERAVADIRQGHDTLLQTIARAARTLPHATDDASGSPCALPQPDEG